MEHHQKVALQRAAVSAILANTFAIRASKLSDKVELDFHSLVEVCHRFACKELAQDYAFEQTYRRARNGTSFRAGGMEEVARLLSARLHQIDRRARAANRRADRLETCLREILRALPRGDGARAHIEAALATLPEPQKSFTRDDLGRIVREAWIEWAKRQSEPKPSWLVPYDALDERDKEADRMIGSAVLLALRS